MRSTILVIALFGVARADDVDVPGRASPDLRGDAMVWEDAALYLEPSESGTNIRFSTFGRARRDEVSRAFPVRIVSAALRDFVEVELVEDSTCAPQTAHVDPRITGLHVFVKRTDLAPVLVKPFAAKYSDGTSVRLRPGVPVTPTVSGAYMIGARGDALRLNIPHGSVGFTYRRTKVDEPALPKGQLWRLERTQVKLGGGDFEVRGRWLAATPRKTGETVNVRWSTRCIELVVGVPSKSLRRVTRPSDPHYLFARTRPVPSKHAIPRGATLSTFTGREVAIAAEDIDVHPNPEHAKACFDASFELRRLDERGSMLRRPVRLCAPLDAIEGPPLPEGAAGPIDPLAAPPDVASPPRDARRTAKGVYWKRLVAGKGGKKPTEDSTVLVHYTGWTTDGTMFDSTHKRGQPARFPLRAVIAGWTDGLQTMSIGDKTRLWIPEELAYKGAPGPPQGMLVFDVELLSVE